MLDKLVESRLHKKGDLVDVITFTESSWGLGIPLFPVQKFILKIMHGIRLDRVTPAIKIYADCFKEKVERVLTEFEYLQFLKDKGRISPTYQDGDVRRETVLAIGRRGSKTRLSSICCLYNMYKLMALYNPQKHYGVPEGEKIGFVAVATAQDQAKELFAPIRVCVLNSPYFERELIKGSSDDSIKLQTRHTHQKLGEMGPPSIVAQAAPCSSRGIRGASNIVVVFDEFAHFILEAGNRSDEEVYKALTPSVAFFGKDGRIISISSPLSKSGKFYSLFTQGMTDNPDILSFQAPCWEVNELLSPETLKSEYRKDPDSYMNEFGAQWSGHSVDFIRDPDVYEQNVVLPKAAQYGVRHAVYNMGVDIGKENDSTVFCVGHVDELGIINADLIEVYTPEDLRILAESNPDLLTSEGVMTLRAIASRINDLCDKFSIQKGVYDQFNGWGLSEFLREFGRSSQFEMVHYTRALNSQMYKSFRRLLYEKRIKFYPHEAFRKELFSLQSFTFSKNEMVVEAPSGGHDDMADAVVRMAWLCTESRIDKPNPVASIYLGGSEWITPKHGEGGGLGTGLSSQKLYEQRKRRMMGGTLRHDGLQRRR